MSVQILTIETPGLGDRTHVAHDGEVAVVVDPQRDLDRVLELVEAHDLRISHVLETHVHNDYVSGGAALARRTGAAYVLNAADDLFVDHLGVEDGDVLEAGTMQVRVLAAPGHTPTHLAYVLAHGGRDVAVFTGGSLLHGAVGRTDLVSRALVDELSRAQHATAHHLADVLDDEVEVRPTHGFGSFCSSVSVDAESASPTDQHGVTISTIGRERRENVALTTQDVDDFVAQLVAGLDAYPRYYVHMAPRNRLGAEPVDLSPPVTADPAQLAARIHAGEWVVDLRTRRAYAADHVRGTVNVELSGSFLTYLGWVVPWGTPVTLVGDTADEVADAQRQLTRIGIDRPAAAAHGGVESFGAGLEHGTYRVADFEELGKALAADADTVVVDARRAGEWADGHLPTALHVPLHDLPQALDRIPDGTVWVHCASGFRASIGASLLARAGRDVVLVDDDWDNVRSAGLDIDG